MNVITEKVGPLPLVVWVAGGAGVIGLFIVMTHKGNNGAAANQTNSVQSLAPTEAEAFGTLEQQQQDVTNALTTLGQNQSALGGSMSTLTGIVTQQGADNAAAFQNLVDGQNSILSGQTAAANQATNYYNSILKNSQNYYSSLSGQMNGLSGEQQQIGQGLFWNIASIYSRLTANIAQSTGSGTPQQIADLVKASNDQANAAVASFTSSNQYAGVAQQGLSTQSPSAPQLV